LCELSSKKGYAVFFLGGRPKDALGRHVIQVDKDLAELAGEEIKKLYPGLNVVGETSKFSSEIKDDRKTIDYIQKSMHEKGVDHIDFLFVAYGHSKQERWISRNIHKVPAKVAIGLGGTFDYISGQVKLPPEIYIKKNLGWVYRLIVQPWRVKRILKAFPLFPLKVFRDSIQS
jgi:N-acetylglucosaminyldiphosphoundecaprenol N-acetyl-beta-D-mannosaminyltransferase